MTETAIWVVVISIRLISKSSDSRSPLWDSSLRVNRMGGTQGLVNALSRFAKGPRSAQGVTCAMGTAIFFDDYANTVVVGTTARSLTDRYRVSREKLAYIVDSTSAPVAGIAIISTWIGYEVGLFDDLLGTLNGVPGMPSSGYELFFAILPFRFYCILALVFVVLNAATGRDYGPMYHAEKRARSGGSLGAIKADSEDQDQDRFARADIAETGAKCCDSNRLCAALNRRLHHLHRSGCRKRRPRYIAWLATRI